MFFARPSAGCSGICLAAVVSLALLAGCQELVHMGQLSDQESAFAISNARIEQQQADGGWLLLGKTDGTGRWWIMKKNIRSGGRIRIVKPGYYPVEKMEGEFLQEYNLLMIPSGGMGPGVGDRQGWGSGSG